MMVRHPILEASNNLNTDLSKTNCEYMEAEDAMQVLSNASYFSTPPYLH